MDQPFFSVIIPAYKTAHLRSAIGSVLGQTAGRYELLVVDDCSPHGVKTVVEALADSRIQYQCTPRNLGADDPSRTWNYALDLIKGDFVVLLGDDDELAVNYLAEMETLIRKYPGASIYRSRLRLIDGEGKVFEHGWSLPELETWDEYFYFRRKYWRLQSTSEMTVRATSLRNIGGYASMPLAIGSDDLTWQKLCVDHPMVSSNNTFACWRCHSESVSFKVSMDRTLVDACLNELYLRLREFLSQHQPLIIDRELLAELLPVDNSSSPARTKLVKKFKLILREILPPFLLRILSYWKSEKP